MLFRLPGLDDQPQYLSGGKASSQAPFIATTIERRLSAQARESINDGPELQNPRVIPFDST